MRVHSLARAVSLQVYRVNDEPSFWGALSDLARTFAYGGFAAIAGLLGHLMRVIEQGGKVSFWIALVKALSSGFAGVLIYMACQALDVSGPWVGVIVGTTGWMGADASIRLLETLIYRKLGITKEVRQDDQGTAA